MDSNMMYCRSCGKVIPRNSKFCRFCGFQYMKPAAESSAKNSAAVKPSPEKKPPKKKKRTGLKLLIAALAVFFLYKGLISPGFLLKKPGHDQDNRPKDPKVPFTSAKESRDVSADALTADFAKSGVQVSLTEYVLDKDRQETLTVESAKPVYAENGDYVIMPYHISLGDVHELSDFIEIRIPYNTTFCDKGEDPSKCVGGVYLNPESGEWEETLYTVDENAQEVVILTDHFSDYGAMTVKNSGRRDAYLSGGNSAFLSENEDLGFLNESQAVSALQEVCEKQSADTFSARLAGNQVMQAAMSLGGAVSDLSDAAGATYSFAYFLDLADKSMVGNYLEIAPEIEVWGYKLGSKLDPNFAYSNKTFNIYNDEMMAKSGKILSTVGTVISGCKVVYLAGKAASGSAEDSDIFQLYKDSASLAISLGGSATLSALMGPVMLADVFINYMFTESFAIKEAQTEEMYVWFNEKYPGSGAPDYTRPGRSAADWRKVIIELIDENPGESTEDLLKTEIDDFLDDFWNLSSDGMADVVAQMPKTIKRIPIDDKKLRNKVTEGYKKQLYDLLDRAVMPSVRDYYHKKMLKNALRSINDAKKFYNQVITFDVFEPEHTDKKGRKGSEADNVYGGYKCAFLPLGNGADIENWSSVLPEKNVGLHGEFTLLGYLLAGEPKYFAVFEPDADIRKDDPVLVVPLSVNGEYDGKQNIRITLEPPVESDISAFLGTWYDEDGYEIRIEAFDDGRIGIYNFGWSEDWLYARYKVRPDKKSVEIGGTEYPLNDSDVLVQLIQPEASTYKLSSSYEHFMGVDETGQALALFLAGGVYGYMREKPVKEETTFEFYIPDPNVVIPPGGDE